MSFFDIVKIWCASLLLLLQVSQYASATTDDVLRATLVEKANLQQQAPDFSLRALDGGLVSLDDLLQDGHVLLLFWSMDCVYCVAHMPDYQRLYENYKEKGLSFVAINIGGENYEDIAEFAKQNMLNFVFLSNRHHNFKVAEQYAVIGTPTLILVSPDGEMLYRGHAVPDMRQWFIEEQKVANQQLP